MRKAITTGPGQAQEMRVGHLWTNLVRLLYQDWLRRPVVWLVERRLRAPLERVHPTWREIERQRRLIYSAVVHTVDRVIGQRLLSPHVAAVIARLWSRALRPSPGQRSAARRFREEHGSDPPWFLVVSPTQACNLRCAGCYADSGPSDAHLDWATLDRVMTDAERLWNVPLFVFSGGEPLTYRSAGHDLLDIVERHADCLFLMFTNGTLIDRATAQRLARLGNLTPALSVEGMRARTDERRGPGTFDRVLRAMADLREAGVPFGVSVTATRANCEEILSDEFLDFFFHQQGAFYEFIFQYTPIGRGCHLDWLPTAEQATAFWRRSWEVIQKKHLFLLDFWNHGPLVEGCIAAGRDRGYLYIDWNGHVIPCVFAPYAAADLRQTYAQGGTLNDIWAAPFFAAIRAWQREHGYGKRELTPEHNWLRPCPFRDYHAQFREWVARYGPQPADETAAAALTDEHYYEQMVAYGQQQRACTQPLWEQKYVRPS